MRREPSLPYRPLEQRTGNIMVATDLSAASERSATAGVDSAAAAGSGSAGNHHFVQPRRRRRKRKLKKARTSGGVGRVTGDLFNFLVGSITGSGSGGSGSEPSTDEKILVGAIVCVMILFATGTILGFLYLTLADLPDGSIHHHNANHHRHHHGTGFGGGGGSLLMADSGTSIAGVANTMQRVGRTKGERVRNLLRMLGNKMKGRNYNNNNIDEERDEKLLTKKKRRKRYRDDEEGGRGGGLRKAGEPVKDTQEVGIIADADAAEVQEGDANGDDEENANMNRIQ